MLIRVLTTNLLLSFLPDSKTAIAIANGAEKHRRRYDYIQTLAQIALDSRLQRLKPFVNRYLSIENFIRCLKETRRDFVVIGTRHR
jgi:hypothetical protein